MAKKKSRRQIKAERAAACRRAWRAGDDSAYWVAYYAAQADYYAAWRATPTNLSLGAQRRWAQNRQRATARLNAIGRLYTGDPWSPSRFRCLPAETGRRRPVL